MQRVRRAYGTRAVGHTGTLDPFATGLLVALVGRATRLARFVEGQAKTYLAEARLGLATDTDDLTGAPLGAARPVDVTEQAVHDALDRFRGAGWQRPPAFSAKHVAGARSYQLARRGQAVELPPVAIEVLSVELVEFAAGAVHFRVVVSAGTYVRAMARDLGEALGTGAHLTALRRERIGVLDVSDAVPLDRLGPATPLLPPEAVLPGLPRHELADEDAAAIRHGRQIAETSVGTGPVALMHGGALLAIGDPADGMIQPRVVLEGS